MVESEPLKGNSPRSVPWIRPGLTKLYLDQGLSDWHSRNRDEEQWSGISQDRTELVPASSKEL